MKSFLLHNAILGFLRHTNWLFPCISLIALFCYDEKFVIPFIPTSPLESYTGAKIYKYDTFRHLFSNPIISFATINTTKSQIAIGQFSEREICICVRCSVAVKGHGHSPYADDGEWKTDVVFFVNL